MTEVGDSDPKCMILFSWILICVGKINNVKLINIIMFSSGIVMLGAVVMIMGQLLLDWSLDNLENIENATIAHNIVDHHPCSCVCS